MKKIVGLSLAMSVSLVHAMDRHTPADGHYASYAEAAAQAGTAVVEPAAVVVRVRSESPRSLALRDLKNRERVLTRLMDDIERDLVLARRDLSSSPRSAGLTAQVGTLESQLATVQDELNEVQLDIEQSTASHIEEEIEEDSDASGE